MKVEQNSHEPSNYRASTNPTLGISSVAGTRQPAGLPRGRLVCRRRPTAAVGPIEASFLFHLYGTDAVLIRLEDLNLRSLTGTCTSSMRVCQFRHDRKYRTRS